MTQLTLDFDGLNRLPKTEIQAKYDKALNEYQCLLHADLSYQFEGEERSKVLATIETLQEVARINNFELK